MKQVTIEKVLEILNIIIVDREISFEHLNENLSQLGVNSIGFIQLIVALEEKFECEIPDSKLLISEMNTPLKIIYTLQKLYDESKI